MRCRLHQLATALFISCVINTSATVLYVDLNSPNPTSPFTNWVTAAANIQDAVDAANTGDQVLVTNGVYQAGGRTVNGFALTNRVVINKAITVESVSGPALTTIRGFQVPDSTNGDGAVRCVYMTNNAALIGFTLTGGATRTNVSGVLQERCGGGVWCDSTNALIQNCLLLNNSAAWRGGGAANGTFSNCTFIGNAASDTGYGGGAYNSVLNGYCLIANTANYGGGISGGIVNNCTLTNNSAFTAGGGIANAGGDCTANNCVLVGNTAVLAGGGASSCTLSNCYMTGNTVSSGGWGGGAAYSTLVNCQVISNLALGSFGYGGGVYQSTLNNCTLVGNWAGQFGGASYYGTLNNCVLTRNTATYGSGGGAYYGTLNNCTLTGNWARDSGGGAYFSTLNNCIIYYNNSGQYPNYYLSLPENPSIARRGVIQSCQLT